MGGHGEVLPVVGDHCCRTDVHHLHSDERVRFVQGAEVIRALVNAEFCRAGVRKECLCEQERQCLVNGAAAEIRPVLAVGRERGHRRVNNGGPVGDARNGRTVVQLDGVWAVVAGTRCQRKACCDRNGDEAHTHSRRSFTFVTRWSLPLVSSRLARVFVGAMFSRRFLPLISRQMNCAVSTASSCVRCA